MDDYFKTEVLYISAYCIFNAAVENSGRGSVLSSTLVKPVGS